MNDQQTPAPSPVDGRNIDPQVGLLEGEGAQQKIKKLQSASPVQEVLSVPASAFLERQEIPTYYNQPVLKEPVWIPTIPLYFYVGGLAGASSALGAAARLVGGARFERLARRARWAGAVGDAAGAVLLISDLGRPSRFLNMLRVFRPTSPMSMGAWILSASGALNGAGVALGMVPGAEPFAAAAEYAGGLLGLALSGYTGVLLANSAVPVWQGAYRSLPPLFMASGMSSAGAAFQLMDDLSVREQRLARRYTVVGQVAELVLSALLEREVGRSKEAARSISHGSSGSLWKTAKVLTAASLALSLLPGEQRWKRRAAGILGTAGSLAMRFGIFHAGKKSARDPKATFAQQRQGLGAAEVTGRSAVTGPGERALASQSLSLPGSDGLSQR